MVMYLYTAHIREKWPKKSWEEGEIGGKSREEGENVR